MSAKKKPVSTPLHLLQQLTASLIEHFEQACTQALTDAEKVLAKLEKQRVKVQEKLHKQRARIEGAAAEGKSKAQAKARANAKELEQSLDALQQRQAETRQYIGQLKNDIQAGLALVQGVGKVREAAGKALDQRSGAVAAKPVRKPATARAATSRASAARKPAAPVLLALEPEAAATKPATRKPSSRKAPLAKAVASSVDALAAPAPQRAPRKPRTAKAVPAKGSAPAETPVNGAAAPSSAS